MGPVASRCRHRHVALPVAEYIAPQAKPGGSSLHEDGRAPTSLLRDLPPLDTKGKFRVLRTNVERRELYLEVEPEETGGLGPFKKLRVLWCANDVVNVVIADATEPGGGF